MTLMRTTCVQVCSLSERVKKELQQREELSQQLSGATTAERKAVTAVLAHERELADLNTKVLPLY